MPLFALGFRPFFLGAMLFAVIGMLCWMGIYSFNIPIHLAALPSLTWHSHEMVFGYGCAIVAGFLLTAVRNWTGIPTPTGWLLGLMFSCWLGARIMPFVGEGLPLQLMAVLDCAFLLSLLIAFSMPIIITHARHNLPIALKLALLLGSNIVFYLGELGYAGNGATAGIFSGFYLLIALIFTIARRVIPFFIERGVGGDVSLKNYRWVDLSSMSIFLLFWLVEVILPAATLGAALALLLCALHSVRLAGWYHPGIWRKPLLWVLYLAYVGVIAGFGLKGATLFLPDLNPNLSIHALALGGIGMMTAGMLARITLGHTGRDVYHPPRGLSTVFGLLLLALLARVLLPLLLPEHYLLLITLSQGLWIAAFIGLLVMYAPMLCRVRVDGKPG